MSVEREEGKKSPESDSGVSTGSLGRYGGLRPWKPGESGNPGGMPKGWSELKRAAREQTAEAVERLVNLMRGKDAHGEKVPARTQHAAIETLLDRGWGKPAQVIEGEGEQLIVTVRTASGADPFVTPQKTN